MKKTAAAVLCVLMMSSCTPQKAPENTAAPLSAPTSAPVRTMIAPTDKISDDKMTVLGETSVTVDGEFCDIALATDAERADDGYMMWDDSQRWTLTVTNDENTFVLLDTHMHGKAYFDVTKRGEETVITLIRTTSAGITATEYTYADGAFYAEELITAAKDGNNIYSSIPDYIE